MFLIVSVGPGSVSFDMDRNPDPDQAQLLIQIHGNYMVPQHCWPLAWQASLLPVGEN